MYLLKPSSGSFLLVLSAAKGSGEFTYGAAANTLNLENTTPFPSFSFPGKMKRKSQNQKLLCFSTF